jgi:hypothetical protein
MGKLHKQLLHNVLRSINAAYFGKSPGCPLVAQNQAGMVGRYSENSTQFSQNPTIERPTCDSSLSANSTAVGRKLIATVFGRMFLN